MSEIIRIERQGIDKDKRTGEKVIWSIRFLCSDCRKGVDPNSMFCSHCGVKFPTKGGFRVVTTT